MGLSTEFRLLQNQSNVEQIRRDIAGIGLKRSKLTLELAGRLNPIAIVSGDAKAIYNASKLALCGSERNIYTGIDMNNSDGESFDGVGHLWACSLPYCQNCVALKASRHRRRIRDTLAKLKPLVGLKWRFVTLTSPSVSSSPLLAIKVYQTAWALLRKRKFWKGHFFAGYRGIEFTVNPVTGLVHCHIHFLALSKRFDYKELRSDWTDCITKAWESEGVSLHFDTADEMAMVKVKEPRPREKQLGQKAMDAAILETAKYCADGAAWASLSDNALLEIAKLERFPRLFETFGDTRKFNDDSILDNPDLSDGKTAQHLKTTKPKRVKDLTTLNLLVNVNRVYRKIYLEKRYPVARFKTLDGVDFLPSEPLPSEPHRPKLKLIKGNKIDEFTRITLRPSKRNGNRTGTN
jgi:plasmid rolling circle replication initiator protein Rep